MRYLAQTIVDHITKEASGEGTFRFVLPSYPPHLLLQIGIDLEEQFSRVIDRRVRFDYGVAYELGQAWSASTDAGEREDFRQIRERGWYNEDNNLTSLRNQLRDTDRDDTLVTVVAGYDHIPDRASLLDFFHLDDNTIWNLCLRGSFESWVQDGFRDVLDPEDHETTIGSISDLLRTVYRQVPADLVQISSYLQGLDLSGIYTGSDAYALVLGDLSVFNLPPMLGLIRKRDRRALSRFLDRAQGFANYSMFLESSRRRSALQAIEAFRESEAYREPEERELLGELENLDELVAALECYVEERSEHDRQRLLTVDFVYLHEQVLGYKPPVTPRTTRTRPHTLRGLPPEVFLRAIWLTLREYSRKANGDQILPEEDLQGITVQSQQFRHDFGDRELAQEFLIKVLGGINELLESHISLGQEEGKQSIALRVLLSPSDDHEPSYPSSPRAEPRLQFTVVVDRASGGHFRREFHWMLPQNHQSRLLVNLYDWALDAFTQDGNGLYAYAVPYIPEIYMARDEDEVNRLVGVALSSPGRRTVNLLDAPGIDATDPVISSLFGLSLSFQKFLKSVSQEGFFHALETRYDELRHSYLGASRELLTYSDSSSLHGPLLKAFYIVDERLTTDSGWAWKSALDCAVVTPLHPAMLDMIRHQHTFLNESFCVEAAEALRVPGGRRFAERYWDRITELGEMERPVYGTLASQTSLDSTVRSYGYLHLVGNCTRPSTQISSRLLLDYDVDDENVSDTDIFRDSRASTLVRNTLLDYRKLHVHADDGISIGAYCGGEIQPVIAGIDAYLKQILQEREERPYGLQVTIFSSSRDDSSAMRWLNAWRERWQEAELSSSKRHYANCRISVAYRVVPSGETRERFARLLRDTPLDIMLFTDFIEATACRLEDVDVDDLPQEGYRQFPVLDMTCCAVTGGGKDARRERVVSHRRFALAAHHGEVMARIVRGNIPSGKRHMVISESDFHPWQPVIAAAHKSSAWVVCVDSSVDEELLRRNADESVIQREIIGFGTGVGAHGEDNYTVSTEQFRLNDIQRRVGTQIGERMGPWSVDTCERMAQSLVREASEISGLSIVKATGPSEYVRDYIAYATLRKLLRSDPDAFCDQLVSLDAFSHWFDDARQGTRPDLLRLRARIVDGYFDIEAQVIECKLAQWSEGHLTKARDQVAAGLALLVSQFRPRQLDETSGIDDRPDQRYWWMQMHRLLASRGSTSQPNYRYMLTALERLAEGFFTIRWQGAVVAFWTDSDRSSFQRETEWQLQIEREELSLAAFTSGDEMVRQICLEGFTQDLFEDAPSLIRELRRPEPLTVSPSPKSTEDIIDASNDDGKVVKIDNPPERADRSKEPDGDGESEPNQDITVPAKHIAEQVLLGHTLPGDREAFWEFGHPELPNRHILVFGASGTGKTYTIQAILCELAKLGQNSLIVDYTDGFTTNQMEAITRERLKPKQHLIRQQPLSINPFRQQSQYIDGMALDEAPSNTAERVAGVFAEVYQLGDQQKSVLYSAIRDGIRENGSELTLESLMGRIEERIEAGGPVASSAASVVSKVRPFVDMHPFGNEDQESWEAMYTDEESRCHVIQLAGFSRDTSRLITEFSLIDLYRYYRAQGDKDRPRVVVLDEIQNLDHRHNSPLAQLLTEGRKFGISLILATQILSGLSRDERDRLFQASHKLFFKPADTELRSFAQILEDTTGERSEMWIQRLSRLARGECYSIGPGKSEADGTLSTRRYTKIAIRSLEERF